MKFKIELHENWRDGRRMWNAGVWRVPADMPEAVAVRAVREAGATRIDPPRPAYQPHKPKAAAKKTETVTKAVIAPENK